MNISHPQHASTHEDPIRWHDDPISEPTDDKLGRLSVAAQAARLISDQHRSDTSLVFGLEGPWGSGKSSVIALIELCLRDEDEGKWEIVHFTPWATSGTEGLFAEFFATLLAIAPTEAKSNSLREKIGYYSSIARPIAAIAPVIGPGLAEASRTFDESLKKPWRVAFADLSAELASIARPVLIVVDDIDRLQTQELLDLLKVVRLLGRFPGIDFLLAYDEKTLVHTLQDPTRGLVNKGHARAFMEKIVQYPISIPPLLTSKIANMLSAGLSNAMSPRASTYSSERERLDDVTFGVMPHHLSTPRSINRFLAKVRESLAGQDLDEVNEVDIALSSFLEVAFPDLFQDLHYWKSDLTKGSDSASMDGLFDESVQDWTGLLATLEGDRDHQHALRTLAAIFPVIETKYAPRAELGRFAHPNYFDRFVARTVPEGDIADRVILDSLRGASDGDSSKLKMLILQSPPDESTLALMKILDRYPRGRSISHLAADQYGPIDESTLGAAMEMLEESSDRLEDWSSTQPLISRWAANLVRLLLSKDPHLNIDQCLQRCKDPHRRSLVISSAVANPMPLTPETNDALSALKLREAESLIPIVMGNITDRDSASNLRGSAFLLDFISDSEALTSFQNQLQESLAGQAFTHEDIAARLVSFSYALGGDRTPESVSFNSKTYERVTGFSAKASEYDDASSLAPWGWPERRAYSAQLIARN